MLKKVLGALADGKVAHPRESIEAILASEIGELQRKWTDNRSFLGDFQEWASKERDSGWRERAVEKSVYDHLSDRIRTRLGKAKDITIEMEVQYFEAPAPGLFVKLLVSEGDTIHAPVKFRTSLEFAPEPFALNLAKIEPAPQKATLKQTAAVGQPRTTRPSR